MTRLNLTTLNERIFRHLHSNELAVEAGMWLYDRDLRRFLPFLGHVWEDGCYYKVESQYFPLFSAQSCISNDRVININLTFPDQAELIALEFMLKFGGE